MITFYPRDIGLWREDFDFSDRANYPTKTFKDRDELSEFVLKKYGMDDEEFPLKFLENESIYSPFDSTHTVHKWTVLGWMKETQDNQ